MTQYPEALLARELELCYANISLITDYDVGVEGVPPVTNDEVVRVFTENNERLRDLLFAVIPALPRRAGLRVRDRRSPAPASRSDDGRATPYWSASSSRSAPPTTRAREALGDRIREAVAMIVGRARRWRSSASASSRSRRRKARARSTDLARNVTAVTARRAGPASVPSHVRIHACERRPSCRWPSRWSVPSPSWP